MEEIIRLTNPIRSRREALLSLAKSILFYSAIAAVTAGIIYSSREAQSAYHSVKGRLINWLISEDLFQKSFELDRKGRVAKVGDMEPKQVLEALYICTSQNEQYQFQLDTIKSFVEQ